MYRTLNQILTVFSGREKLFVLFKVKNIALFELIILIKRLFEMGNPCGVRGINHLQEIYDAAF